jgi:hypothetical protein
MLNKKIISGLSWALIASAAITSAFLVFVPVLNKWSLFALSITIAIILVVGVLKGLRSKEIVCNSCGTMFRLISSQNRCPECGNQSQPFSP